MNVCLFLCAVSVSVSVMTYAANTVEFSFTISPGQLTADIRTITTQNSVAAPEVAFGSTAFKRADNAVSATLPASGQELFIDNQDAADSGWTLTIAPEGGGGGTSTWVGADHTLTINSATGGRLTINPGDGTLTSYSPTNVTCSTSGVSLGGETSFVSNNSVTLLTAAGGAADICQYGMTGISMVQRVPVNQPADNYSITMSLTVAAT